MTSRFVFVLLDSQYHLTYIHTIQTLRYHISHLASLQHLDLYYDNTINLQVHDLQATSGTLVSTILSCEIAKGKNAKRVERLINSEVNPCPNRSKMWI